MTGPGSGIAAVRLALDPGPGIDPFALAGEKGFLFHTEHGVRVGLGRSLSFALPHGLDADSELRRVTDVLATLPCDDHCPSMGSALVAMGALPFDRSAPTYLTVPEIVYGRDHGSEWVTVVAPPAALPSSPVGLRSWLRAAANVSGGTAWPEEGELLRMIPRASDQSFTAMVETALAAIGRGELVKVVLARHVDAQSDQPVDVPGLLRRWHDLEPNCTVFSVPTAGGQFVGASPELLVERAGTTVHSRPLAGTAERFVGDAGSLLPPALLESGKDAHEHRLVVEGIAEALAPLCTDLDVPDQPDLVRLHNLVHLGTSLRGTLAGRPLVPNCLQLVAALHPTPAVGGVPTEVACALIHRLEPEPRGVYAGAVGYVDSDGDGRWVLGIRAMTVEGGLARLTAGVGIVAGSDPAVELAETNVKLTAVVDALAPDGRYRSHATSSLPTTAG